MRFSLSDFTEDGFYRQRT